ncbi:MAG: hypothetical protein ACK4MF_05800 [Hyphomicrobiaceae bacterium]
MTPSATAGAPKRRRWGWWIFAGSLLALAALIVWFAFFWGTKRLAWREVIWFEDGTRIELRRQTKLKRTYYELSHPGWKPEQERIVFPDGVHFDTDDSLVLMRVQPGESHVRWVLIASPLFCEEFNKYGRPKPDYIQFEYADGRWTYRPVESRFFGKPANLLVNYRGIPPSGVVTEGERWQWNSTAERIANEYLVITFDEPAWRQRDRGCNEGLIFN